jgi:large subunit ribosomal protein L4
MMKNLGVNGKKSLFVIPEDNYNLYLSLRNVANVNGTLIRDINTYDIINANVLVLTENAAKVFTAEEAEA